MHSLDNVQVLHYSARTSEDGKEEEEESDSEDSEGRTWSVLQQIVVQYVTTETRTLRAGMEVVEEHGQFVHNWMFETPLITFTNGTATPHPEAKWVLGC